MTDYLGNLTVVLVQGAWMDGSSWTKVAPPLEAQGLNVVAAQLPLSSLSDDVAALDRLLRRQAGPSLLVAHSYGGAVTTAAAAGNPAVKGLVYIAAIVPDQGETVGEIFGRVAPDPRAPVLRPDEAGLLWVTASAFGGAISPGASAGEIAMLAATQKPISVQCLGEPLKGAGWREKPSWFLIAEKDVMVSPETQRFTAERMQAKTISLPVDHSPMFSQPEGVVALIDGAARAVGGGRVGRDVSAHSIAASPTETIQ